MMIQDMRHRSLRQRCAGVVDRLDGRRWFVMVLAVAAAGFPGPGRAQPPGEQRAADSLARIDADYQRQRTQLDRERIERLTRLAKSQKRGEAELTLLEVLRFAIATDRYDAAEPAADLAIRGGADSREAVFLAQLVKVVAEADRGDYDGSMRDLKAYLTAPVPRGETETSPQGQSRTTLALSEAYFRRLVRGRRFDLAREVCDLAVKHAADPALREHFEGYRRRLDLVGRPAPLIDGPDADGNPVRIEDFRGKVVLVVFWASWCSPCIERLPALTRAWELHEKDGLAIVGVNLDSGPDRDRLVRRFLVDYAIPWPTVLSGKAERDVAERYAVSEIPANVLIGRDGTVITFDLAPADLLHAVAGALKRTSGAR